VRPPSGAALLLSQLGAHVSRRFAERLAPLDLSPAHVAVLRVVGQNPGIGQRELAEELGVVPSRVVVLIDELEERGIIERRRSTTDRRQYALHIAEDAEQKRRAVMRAVGEHDVDVTSALTQAELRTLVGLLRKIAAAQGLAPQGRPDRPGG
jgi:DNA-binding MarR family transcriptional regulator